MHIFMHLYTGITPISAGPPSISSMCVIWLWFSKGWYVQIWHWGCAWEIKHIFLFHSLTHLKLTTGMCFIVWPKFSGKLQGYISCFNPNFAGNCWCTCHRLTKVLQLITGIHCMIYFNKQSIHSNGPLGIYVTTATREKENAADVLLSSSI